MNKFSYDSSQYTAYRPRYPDQLFQYLKKFVNKNDTVLECGAGSGQATKDLAQYFNMIIANDLSFELLSEMSILPNVNRIQSSAECLPISSQSIKLVCVAQALHWFRLEDFYKEVRRVLKSDGIISAWCYNQAVIEPAIDKAIRKIYLKIITSQNYSFERQFVYDHYQTIPFPFTRIKAPTFKIEMHWNLMQLLGYIGTWPGLLEYQKKFNIDLVSELKDELISLWGDPYKTKLIIWPIYFLMGLS